MLSNEDKLVVEKKWNNTLYLFLFLFALFRRMSAFFLADPEPWEPVTYFFFLALVFVPPVSCFFSFLGPPRNVMPFWMTKSMSSPPWFDISAELVVEQTYIGESHGDTIFVARLYHVVIADRSTSLGDVLHTALVSPLHVVAKGEECV